MLLSLTETGEEKFHYLETKQEVGTRNEES
jgi:hypothetical protein